jgi:hypothetical protein
MVGPPGEQVDARGAAPVNPAAAADNIREEPVQSFTRRCARMSRRCFGGARHATGGEGFGEAGRRSAAPVTFRRV